MPHTQDTSTYYDMVLQGPRQRDVGLSRHHSRPGSSANRRSSVFRVHGENRGFLSRTIPGTYSSLFTSEDNLPLTRLFVVFFPLSRLLSVGYRMRSLDRLDRGIEYHRASLD